LAPGDELDGGRYRVLRALGRGGMGAVWLVAQTRAFDRPAVLKEVIDYFDPLDPDARRRAAERFEAEARTLGELKHPGIPDLYAYFSEGEHHYLVMELIEGPSLADGPDAGRPRRAALPPADVLHYTAEIAAVLEYLAGRQPPVVHNDVKPANIVVDQNSGQAVLVDFGTAQTRYLRSVRRGTRPDPQSDSVYGTVGYAAPELYRGQAEPRSDVYALAATAYHLLTGDDPRDHPNQYPKLATLPSALAEALRGALAEEVDRRPTAAEFRRQLEAVQAGQTGPLRPLAFPDGDAADDRDELLRLAVRHWPTAAGLLQDGTLVQWLRGTLRDGPAALAAEAALRRFPSDPDAALDAFIRQLDPAVLPPAHMDVQTRSLSLSVGAGQTAVQEIVVANSGRGPLHGEAYTTQPWARLAGPSFTCPPGGTCRLRLTIDTAGLAPGPGPQVAALTLSPGGGPPEVVPIQLTVVAPTVRVDPARVDFGVVDRRAGPARRALHLTNPGPAPARCRIAGAPAWLLVRPTAVDLPPGAAQPVELEARPAQVPGRGQDATLTLAVDQGPTLPLAVSIRVKGGGLFG
jgi:serine/threonine protein kinase